VAGVSRPVVVVNELEEGVKQLLVEVMRLVF